MNCGQRVTLRKLYPYLSDERLAEVLQVPIESIQRAAWKMDLRREGEPLPPKHNARWSSTEIALLKRWWPDEDSRQIARWLGRGYDAVRNKAVRLGLHKSEARTKKSRRYAARHGAWMQNNFLPGDPGGRILWRQ